MAKLKTDVSESGRVCTKCYQFRPWVEFDLHTRGHNGHAPKCKPCDRDEKRHTYHTNPQQRKKRLETGNAWRKKNRERVAGYWRKGEYGVTVEEFSALLKSQGGFCAICRNKPATHVDHDHRSGNVRGILCNKCNLACGFFSDDPEMCIAAAGYLKP